MFAAELSPTEYIGYVKYLASPEMRGRATGSPELEKAAAFIRDQFRSFNLKPLNGDSYYQDFEVTTSARLGSHNQLKYSNGGEKQTIKSPAGFCSAESLLRRQGRRATWSSPATASPRPNTTTTTTRAWMPKDKIVLVLRHEPQEFDDKSVFEGKVYTAHSQTVNKAVNAKMHGAKAVLLVNDMAAHPSDADQLEKFGTTAGPGQRRHRIRSDEGGSRRQMAGALPARTWTSIEASIDKDLHPQSFALPATSAPECRHRYPPRGEDGSQCGRLLARRDFRIRDRRSALRSSRPGRAVFARAVAGRNRASRRRRQCFRNRRRDRAGALVLASSRNMRAAFCF